MLYIINHIFLKFVSPFAITDFFLQSTLKKVDRSSKTSSLFILPSSGWYIHFSRETSGQRATPWYTYFWMSGLELYNGRFKLSAPNTGAV